MADSKTSDAARDIKEKVLAIAKAHGRIVGIGIGKVDGEYAIKINFAEQPIGELPTEIDGVPIVYAVVGEARSA
jgi:hypothetical protein